MTGPSGGGMDDRNEREGTPPPLTKEQIEGHFSAIKSIIKDYNRQNKADPIRLDFGTDNILLKEGRVARGKDVGEEDLSKPFKEILKTPLTRRIIEFARPEYVMPTNITLYDGSTDPADHLNRFSMAANSGEWPMPVWCRMFRKRLDRRELGAITPVRGQLQRPPDITKEAEVGRIHLVRRVYVDEGSSVEVMFEHCFENLPAKVRAGLRETRTDLVGFAGEVAKPLGKIDLEIPTPKGIATLVTRSTIIAECRLREEKQILTEKQPEVHKTGQPDEGADLTEQILVNPYFPDQIITIGGRLSPDCKNQLKTLLINNMEVFAWEPSDMTGVPRRIIEHSLNVNPHWDPVLQKGRTFSP
ncbi:hypothetical protein Tco_0653097 [Tanacetum coccineum]|uniref:Reverse transcriptase domain-containing protein n=1 Tax=Tanacetum coccineum TaxID=301880 RepID=A0ABQ4WZU2_9ASTR